MREDPYSELAGLMREAAQPQGPVGPVHLRLGTVISADPLKVDVAGTNQEAARFYISHRLVKEHQELLRLDCTGVSEQFNLTVSCPISSHPGSSGTSSGSLATPHCVATQAEPVLKPGDEVLLLTEDDQIFFIIDKVVKAG